MGKGNFIIRNGLKVEGEVIMNQDVTFNGNLNLSPDTTTDVDFENANSVAIPTYVLKDCKGLESNIVTFQNFSEYVGQVVTLASEGPTRWEVTLQPTLEVTSIEECCFDNFKVTNCVSGEVWNIVNYEAWPPGTGFIGSIIKIDGEEGCFSVTGTCEEWTYDAKVLVSDQYETCGECTGVTYTLIPCPEWIGAPTIYTQTDLSSHLGVIIKDSETGICYNVEDCVGPCEPTVPIVYEEITYEECDNCKDNWQLSSCVDGEIIGITTTQSDLWAPPPATFTASTIEGCFNVDKIQEAATIGEVLDIGSLENCENWPCWNFVLLDCDGEELGISDQNLNDFNGLTMSGSNSTHSFSGECFTIETTEEPATLGPLDTSDWVEIDCEECIPPPPVEELSLQLIQVPGTPNWTVILSSNIGETGIGAFQFTIGDEGIEFEEGERGEIVPPSWDFSVAGNTNICFNFVGDEFTINEEVIIATWVLNTEDVITSLSLVSVSNGAGIEYSVGVTIV